MAAAARELVHMTSTRRGEGGFKNCPILQISITNRLCEMQMRDRGGLKYQKLFGRPISMALDDTARAQSQTRPLLDFRLLRQRPNSLQGRRKSNILACPNFRALVVT